MRIFRGLAIAGAASALVSAAVVPTAPAAGAASRALAPACAKKLGPTYRPTVEPSYSGELGNTGSIFFHNIEQAGDHLSGLVYMFGEIGGSGSFTGAVDGHAVRLSGSITPSEGGKWTFTVRGTLSCLMSELTSTSVTTSPKRKLPARVTVSAVCASGDAAPFGLGIPASETPACASRRVLDGVPKGTVPDGGSIPYSWGGGHARTPRPSLGTCVGYRGPHQADCAKWAGGPTHTKGLDCSGFTRWVFYLLTGQDVLGSGSAGSQIARLGPGKDVVGDLVYFKRGNQWPHVGVIVAPGKMIDEPRTGTDLRVDPITTKDGTPHYYAYDFPTES